MKKKSIWASLLLLISIFVLIVCRFFVDAPDWVVRADGLVMLVAIFATSYTTSKYMVEKRKNNFK